MLQKIAFLCVNPLEKFLPPTFQGYIKEYYHMTCEQALLRDEQTYCREIIDTYGEAELLRDHHLYTREGVLHLYYLQSTHKETIEKILSAADLIFVGMAGNKAECDKLFLSILPWKEKTVFLWNEHSCDQNFPRQLQREYKLEAAQILKTKELPFYFNGSSE